MRSVALLALLVAIASGTAITPQPLTAPEAGAAYGIPVGGSSSSSWGTVSNGAGNDFTYTVAGGDVGKNLYFRVTVYECDTAGSNTFQTQVSGDDGTGTTIPYHKGTFNTKSASVGFSFTDGNTDQSWFSGTVNSTVLIATGADSLAKAKSNVFTWNIKLGGTTSLSCHFYADLISYGKLIGAGSVGADGNPGAVQDAWIPCCDGVQSTYQVAMNDLPHKYLEVAATTDKGRFDSLSLTNPGSFLGLVDTTSFPSATYTGSVTARTCLTNQSCEIIAASYYVELQTHSYDYTATDAKDFHATFTLTTKAGVATASATIAFAVAALFALFH